jgi:DNA adenine methylase
VPVSTVQLERREDLSLSLDSSRPKLTPFVKWAGGKGSLVHRLLPFVPRALSKYYEPFLGGGAIFLAVCARDTRFKAFLSDTNPELINGYKMVKSKPSDLIRSLSNLRRRYKSAPNKEDFYYEIRSWEPTGPIERAARFVFLNKTCYNGLYRVNPKGEFNVPFGHHMNPKIFHETNILGVSKALRETHAILRTVDYRKATTNCQMGDFVYFDPPYHPSSETSSFTDYTAKGFGEEDQRELSRVFSRLVHRGCQVLLSNSNTRLVRDLYDDYNRKNILVNRPINCVGTGRTGFRELIVIGHPNQTVLTEQNMPKN